MWWYIGGLLVLAIYYYFSPDIERVADSSKFKKYFILIFVIFPFIAISIWMLASTSFYLTYGFREKLNLDSTIWLYLMVIVSIFLGALFFKLLSKRLQEHYYSKYYRNEVIEVEKYSENEIAKMCEIAVILSDYKIDVDDLNDFYFNYVKPIYEAWINETGYFERDSEREYISEYANAYARRNYERK